MENHDSIRRDEEGKFFPQTRDELVDLVYDEDVHLGSINTSRITDMSFLFSTYNEENKKFDLPERKDYSGIETWDVSHTADMRYMFAGAASFNQPLNGWDVSNVEIMKGMFMHAYRFNQPLDTWDVSHVEDMSNMFDEAMSFNQPLDSWDISQLKRISLMFRGAISFNQPLNGWDVSSVTNANFVFYRAESFNHPLDEWNVARMKYMYGVFENAVSLSEENLRKTIEAWMEKNKDCCSKAFNAAPAGR